MVLKLKSIEKKEMTKIKQVRNRGRYFEFVMNVICSVDYYYYVTRKILNI